MCWYTREKKNPRGWFHIDITWPRVQGRRRCSNTRQWRPEWPAGPWDSWHEESWYIFFHIRIKPWPISGWGLKNRGDDLLFFPSLVLWWPIGRSAAAAAERICRDDQDRIWSNAKKKLVFNSFTSFLSSCLLLILANTRKQLHIWTRLRIITEIARSRSK